MLSSTAASIRRGRMGGMVKVAHKCEAPRYVRQAIKLVKFLQMRKIFLAIF